MDSDDVKRRCRCLEMLAMGDDQYYGMLKELRVLEKRYYEVLGALSSQQQDVICDFVSQCEAMSHRMLELACIYMRFPEA